MPRNLKYLESRPEVVSACCRPTPVDGGAGADVQRFGQNRCKRDIKTISVKEQDVLAVSGDDQSSDNSENLPYPV